MSCASRLSDALAARERLLADPATTACRLFHGAGDGIAGLVIEKLGDVLIAQLHEDKLTLDEAAVRELCAQTAHSLSARAVYGKVFPKDRSAGQDELARLHTDATPWIGTPVEPEFAVLENGVRHLVHAYDGYSTGLFIEHRLNRQRVRDLADGRRVLNAFAYTCGYTVAAALGGATQTVSVDISRKFLEWGKRNLAANSIPLDAHKFILSDIFDYYRRAQRQGHRFDLVILDPPSFARTKHPTRTFAIDRQLDPLIAGALALLDPGGALLLCTNNRGTSYARLEQAVHNAARQLALRRSIQRMQLPEDFPADPDYAKAVLVQLT